MSQINMMFPTGSKELQEYLNKNRVGNKIAPPGAQKVWTITEVTTDEDVPPHPQTGEATTKVTVTIQ